MSWSDERGERVLFLSAVYNNEATLAELHERLLTTAAAAGLDARFLFVDDGSADGSWAVIERLADADPDVGGIRFRANFGQTRALLAGLEASEPDVVVYIDADLEIPPEAVGALAPAIAAGHDFVGGARSTRGGHRPLRRLGAWGFNGLTRLLTGLDIRDVGCGLVAMRANVVDVVVDTMRHRPVQIIKPAMMVAARRPIEVPIAADPPPESSHSTSALLRFALEFVALNAATPLTVVAGTGAAVAASRVRRPARLVAGAAAAGAVTLLAARVLTGRPTGELYEIAERVGWLADADVPAAAPRA